GLDAARGRAGADRDEGLRHRAQADDLDRLLWRRDGALDEQDVERSGGAFRGGFRELCELEPIRERQQVVLEVEDRQLAAVARGELDDADPRALRLVGAAGARGDGLLREGHHNPSRRRSGPSSAIEKTGPSRHTNRLPSWQWPHSPTPHSMRRSRVSHRCSDGTPRSPNASAVAVIIRSGPHTKAVVLEPSISGRGKGNSWVTIPTRPSHSE